MKKNPLMDARLRCPKCGKTKLVDEEKYTSKDGWGKKVVVTPHRCTSCRHSFQTASPLVEGVNG